jgi:DNA-binding transcriptional ArsR family regulator
MFQRRPTGVPAVQITDPSAIAVLASPVRQELFDTIEALGGIATIAELAEQLGRPADGLYYHVELLRRAGLLAAAPAGRSQSGRSERRYRTPGRAGGQVGLGYRARDPRNVAAVRSVVGGMLRIARRDFDRALAGNVVTEGPRRELWAARGTGWVSDAELAAINKLLIELTRLLRRPRGGPRQRLISLCFVLAPMTARPKRRGARTRPASPQRRARASR